MQSTCDIHAGVCGFRTRATVLCDDSQHVTFDLESDCGKIAALGRRLAEAGTLDAYGEIDPRAGSVLLATARDALTGCCAGCVVQVGLFKAMQVAAGLALPKDIIIKLETSHD